MAREKKGILTAELCVHGLIVLYLIKILLILVYSNPEIQPFVYVTF